jgi:hypothetical protein
MYFPFADAVNCSLTLPGAGNRVAYVASVSTVVRTLTPSNGDLITFVLGSNAFEKTSCVVTKCVVLQVYLIISQVEGRRE